MLEDMAGKLRDELLNQVIKLDANSIAVMNRKAATGDVLSFEYKFELDGLPSVGYVVEVKIFDKGGLPTGATYADVLSKLLAEYVAARSEA